MRQLLLFLCALVSCLVILFPSHALADSSIPPGWSVNSTSSQTLGQGQNDNQASPSGAGSTMLQLPTAAIEKAANQQLDSLPSDTIQNFWTQIEQEYGGFLPDVHGASIVRFILNSGGWNFQGVVHGVLRYFFAEILDNVSLLGAIILLCVLSVILQSMQSAFENTIVSQIAYAVIFFVLIGLAIGSFTAAVGYAKHAIQSMTDFMLASVPLVVTLIAASGALASAAFFQPMLLFSVHLVGNIVFLVVFPLVFFSALLDLVSSLSPRYQLTRLAGLLRTGAIAVLGVSLSVFLGIATVEGIGEGVADGVTLRVAKFTVSTFVPVVGKAMSDAAETVASASMLVKNAVGIAGLLIVTCLALFPALKILVLTIIYNGSAALMQPLGDGPMIDTLAALSKSLILIFASVAAVALMFFMAICILLLSANIAVVMT